jgi:hypothetical protein
VELYIFSLYMIYFSCHRNRIMLFKTYFYQCPLIHTRSATVLVVQEVPNLDIHNYLPVHTASLSRRLVSHIYCCENQKISLVRYLVACTWHFEAGHMYVRFLFKLTTRRINYPNLFCYKTLLFRASSLPIIRSFLPYIRRW